MKDKRQKNNGGGEMGNEFKYGQSVISNKVLRRGYERPNYHVWKETREDIHGIFLGLRTLYNGTVTSSYDEGTYFTMKDHFRCALVSPGPLKNPVYVPLWALQHGATTEG